MSKLKMLFSVDIRVQNRVKIKLEKNVKRFRWPNNVNDKMMFDFNFMNLPHKIQLCIYVISWEIMIFSMCAH